MVYTLLGLTRLKEFYYATLGDLVERFFQFWQYTKNMELGGFRDLGLACWHFVLQFSGYYPTEFVGFLGPRNLSTPSFGREVKPLFTCLLFTQCKWSLNITWISGLRPNLRTIDAPSIQIPPPCALACWFVEMPVDETLELLTQTAQ
jgi:hypothetical protein